MNTLVADFNDGNVWTGAQVHRAFLSEDDLRVYKKLYPGLYRWMAIRRRVKSLHATPKP